ncbi:hypothetical protein ACTXT7_004715 [Hymenolepis weldensis]
MKALLAKFEGSVDVTKGVPEFINDPKSGNFLESWYKGPNMPNGMKKQEFAASMNRAGHGRSIYRTSLSNARYNYLKLVNEYNEDYLLKLMEESPKVKLEMVREGVKMANLTCDLALIDSGAKPSPLANFLHLVNAVQVGISLSNVLSSSIGENSAEMLDTKKIVTHRLPQYSLMSTNKKTKTTQEQNQQIFHKKYCRFKPKPKYLRQEIV